MAVSVTICDEVGSSPAHASALRDKFAATVAVSRTQSFLAVGLSALLIFGVLAFGGTDEWAFEILEVGCALLFLAWTWLQISDGIQISVNNLYAPIVLFGLLIASQVLFRLSAYPHLTRIELWKYAAFGSLFLLANHFQETVAHRLLMILAVFGLVMASFALIQYLTYNGKIFWYWPALPTSFGTYPDHSHYAGMMEMLTPIPFAIALTSRVSRYHQVLWIIAGVLMAATIFLSGSRGGMVALLVEMIFFIGIFLLRRNWRMAWPALAICLAIAAFVFWIDDGRVLKQLDSLKSPFTNTAVLSRLDIVRDMPRMLRDRPVTGWGLGLFPSVYAQYRSFSTDLVVNQAHNDYAQVLVETGIIGFACVLWFIVNLYRTGIRNFRADSRLATTTSLAPLAGCTGILVHSLCDFNLHIPANAALFFVLCGIATGRKT